MANNYNHRYRTVEIRPHKWAIIEDEKPLTTLQKRYPTDESSAKWYALMWNYWGSKYDRNNPKCQEPLPDELRWQWLDIMLHKHTPVDEEDEDHIAPDEPTEGQVPKQQTLW